MRFDLRNVNSLSRNLVRVVQFKIHSFFQNRSSSTKSAHANTEASVSGHCFESSGKSVKCVSKKGDFFVSGKENSTEDIFAILHLDLKLLAEEEQREEGFLTKNIFVRREEERRNGLRILLSKRVKGRKRFGRIICTSKKEKRRVKQVRRGVRSLRPLSGKVN